MTGTYLQIKTYLLYIYYGLYKTNTKRNNNDKIQ